ncbi:MAG: hypothetical protein ACNA7U_06590 [Candidatus Izemoplasmataceae bacterium]
MKKLILVLTLALTIFVIGFSTAEAKGKPVFKPTTVEYLEFDVLEFTEFGSMTFDLWAGKTIWAGTVTVVFDEGTLSVIVDAVQEAYDVHIGTYSELPTSRPAPGKMIFQQDGWEIGDELILIVHVAFDYGIEDSEVTGESAYAGEPANSTTAWFNYIAVKFVEVPNDEENPDEPVYGSQTAYAYFGEQSIPFDEDGQPWGWYAEFAAGTYPIYAGAGLNDLSKGTLVGYVTVSDDGEVSVEMLEGYVVVDYHFYIGGSVPERKPGQYKTIDMANPVYMTFHFVVTGEFEK